MVSARADGPRGGRSGHVTRAAIAAILGVAAYFALFGGETAMHQLWQYERQRVAEADSLEILRLSLDSLRARADSLESDTETLERIARERFGLIRDGERLYRFVEPAEAAADPADTEDAGNDLSDSGPDPTVPR